MYDKLHLFSEQTTRIVKFDLPNYGLSIFPNMQRKDSL